MLYISDDMNNTIVKDEVKIENLIENLGIIVDRDLKKWYIVSDWYLGNFRSPKSFYFKDVIYWNNIKALKNY